MASKAACVVSTRVPIETVYLGLFDGPHATPPPADDGPVFLGIKNITEDGRLNLSDVRHISESDYPEWTRRILPTPGDIVFTYEATLNRYAIIPPGFRGCLGRRVALIRPNPEVVDPLFLFYYFFGAEWRATIAKHMILGSTVDRIPLVNFPKFEVSLPPLPVQGKIAAILSAYDNLIENNTRRIAILEEMARALYREWFVEFRFPGHEASRMVASRLGLIPEGWQVASLGDICHEMRVGVDPVDVDPETPYLGLEHLPRRSVAVVDWGAANDVQSGKLKFQAGDILFGKIRPYFHKVAVPPVSGVCSTDAIVIKPNSDELFGLVLGCVSSDDFVAYATKTSQGTKMPRANWDVLTMYPIALPPSAMVCQFDKFIRSLVLQIHNLIFHSRNLRAQRDLLLPRLVSGQVEVERITTGT